MTTTAWAHLPNAVHIDRVIASAKANPEQWADSWDTTWSAVEDVAITAARDLLIKQGRYSVWVESRKAVWNAVRESGRWAILALIAYDDCAYMLDSAPSELAILAALGDNRAIILLPACKVLHSNKELT